MWAGFEELYAWLVNALRKEKKGFLHVYFVCQLSSGFRADFEEKNAIVQDHCLLLVKSWLYNEFETRKTGFSVGTQPCFFFK